MVAAVTKLTNSKAVATTNDERRTTNDERRTTNDERRMNAKRRTTPTDERTNDQRSSFEPPPPTRFGFWILDCGL